MGKRIFIHFILTLISFNYASTTGVNGVTIFSHGQSALNKYYLWQEIGHSSIMNDYFMPVGERKLKWETINKYYQSKNTLTSAHALWRIEPRIIGYSMISGIRQIINGMVAVELSPSLVIQNNFEFDSDGWNDDHFRQGGISETVGDWTGYLQHSSLTYFYQEGHFLMGRGNLYSSVIGNSLLINPHFPPVEYFWLHHKRDRLTYDWSISFLDNVNDHNRFLSLHRYSYETEKLRVGFSELVMVSYVNFGTEELRYIMPASILLETEVNGGIDANLMWAMDFTGKIYHHIILCEIFIDDIAIDGDNPPKIAYKIGIGSNSFYFRYYLEYARVNRWTGNYYYPELRYVENNVLIGHPIGPDAHSIIIKLFKVINDKLFIHTDITLLESGSGDINEWPEEIEGQTFFGWSAEPFPSHPRKSQLFGKIFVDYFFTNSIKITPCIDFSSDNKPEFRLEIGITF